MDSKQIEIPRLLWMRLVSDLRTRGRGSRESGAFLLGKNDESSASVVTYICYDDLDRKALTGIVEFHRAGFSKLWDVCREKGMKVVADVHTHPGEDVRQSSVDKANPMLPVRGHIGLILPRFGDASKWNLSKVGIYRFEGMGKWESFKPDDASCPVRLTMW